MRCICCRRIGDINGKASPFPLLSKMKNMNTLWAKCLYSSCFIETTIRALLNYMHSILYAGYWGIAISLDLSLNIYMDIGKVEEIVSWFFYIKKAYYIICHSELLFGYSKREIGSTKQEWLSDSIPMIDNVMQEYIVSWF